ncbi:UNVERIFIED_CONTAM: putative mitochondrial protein [Sesamum latifolium]|uniref:Mitochondrial protein n=1 Tax=Sesamum latifolium TaxID=2727402 RepID=A0AAW2U375_9LAMI
MAEELMRPYTEEEVTNALFQMSPLKSLGPDGMPPIFFQSLWHVVKSDVVKCALNFLNNATLPPELNATNIVLIPKCPKPESLNQLRPISLCNVAYKIASKAIANRLKPFLDSVISPVQAAFVLGASLQITPLSLLSLTITCLPELGRGLRQGDPLSPYLFLICTEALSSLLSHAEHVGTIPGMAICRNAPRISHLLFADDTLIFSEATTRSMESISLVLDTFARASGQSINFSKSTVVFSHNVDIDLQITLPTILGIRREDHHDKYLELPTCIGRTKRAVFSSIRERIWKRIGGWNEKFLSQAGKEILIEAVLQAIPTYPMSIFKIPDTLLRDIQSFIGDFWWHNKEKRKIHWLSWDKLCVMKKEGGLGLRDLRDFNKAMLAKQLWRLLTNPTSLAGQVLKARYYLNTSVLEASIGSRPSYAWRSILSALPLFRAGIYWKIGAGSSMQNCLIDTSTGEWNATLLDQIFTPIDRDAILAIPLGGAFLPDLPIWHFSHNDRFSVRAAYHLARQLSCYSSASSNPRNWNFIWHAKALSNLPSTVTSCDHFDVEDWTRRAHEKLDEKEFCLFLLVAWAIWKNRNSTLMENSPSQPHAVIGMARSLLQAFWDLNSSMPTKPQSAISRRWIPPSTSFVKINYDAPTFQPSSDIGVGIIARDSNGTCLAWFSHRFARAASPEFAEAIAAREAVKFAIRLGFHNCLIEGDCESIFLKLQAADIDLSPIGSIISEIKILATHLNCSFSIIRRTGNQIAHLLAKHSHLRVESTSFVPPGVFCFVC